jgi:hypothetical protein
MAKNTSEILNELTAAQDDAVQPGGENAPDPVFAALAGSALKTPEPADAPQMTEPMVETWVLNADADRYEKKLVPQSQVKVIFEPEDRFSNDPLALGDQWEKGRGTEMHARWVNINAKHQTTDREAGYAPVRAEDFPSRRYREVRIEGIPGKCLSYGDLVLMEKPKRVDEAQYAARVEKKNAELHEMLYGISEETRDLARSAGVELESKNAQVYGGEQEEGSLPSSPFSNAPSDPRSVYADAEAEEEYYAMAAAGGTTRRTFGGLGGNPQYNKWNPQGAKPNYGYTPPKG